MGMVCAHVWQGCLFLSGFIAEIGRLMARFINIISDRCFLNIKNWSTSISRETSVWGHRWMMVDKIILVDQIDHCWSYKIYHGTLYVTDIWWRWPHSFWKVQSRYSVIKRAEAETLQDQYLDENMGSWSLQASCIYANMIAFTHGISSAYTWCVHRPNRTWRDRAWCLLFRICFKEW